VIKMTPLKLREIIVALHQKGRHDEAEFYQLTTVLQLMTLQGFSESRILDMTVDEVDAYLKLPQKPLKYEGWNFWWGKEAIVARERNNY